MFQLILKANTPDKSLGSGQKQGYVMSGFPDSAKFMLTEEHFKCKDQPQILIQDADVMTRKANNRIIFGGAFTFTFFGNTHCLSSPAFPDTLKPSRRGTRSHNEANHPLSNVHATRALDSIPKQGNNFLYTAPSPLPPPDKPGSPRAEGGWSANNLPKIFS